MYAVYAVCRTSESSLLSLALSLADVYVPGWQHHAPLTAPLPVARLVVAPIAQRQLSVTARPITPSTCPGISHTSAASSPHTDCPRRDVPLWTGQQLSLTAVLPSTCHYRKSLLHANSILTSRCVALKIALGHSDESFCRVLVTLTGRDRLRHTLQ